MLLIPRPRTREQCRLEARPCPWVGCPHHLLLEVSESKAKGRHVRVPSLRMNLPTRPLNGRRSGLAWNAAAHVVRRWIDDAVEQLSKMGYTCVLDWVDDHGWYEEQPAKAVAKVLGVSRQRILVEEQQARRHARREARKRGIDTTL